MIFLGTQLVETYITKRYTDISKSKMLGEIHLQNNFKQKETEKYLYRILGYEQAQTNALLNRIVEHSLIRDHYAPTEDNYNLNTWLSSAMLLGTNKRLDFIQNINEGKLTSLIVMDQPPPRLARKISYGGKVPLFAMESEIYEGEWGGPFVGIEFDLSKEFQGEIPALREPSLFPRTNVAYYLLYDVEAVINMDLVTLKKKIDEVLPAVVKLQIDIDNLTALKKILNRTYEQIKDAQAYLLTRPDLVKVLLSEKRGEWIRKNIPSYEKIQSYDIERADVESQLVIAETRYEQIEQIWQYAIFIASGIFDYNPFDSKAPVGIAHVVDNGSTGKMLLKSDVLLPYPIGCIDEACGGDQNIRNQKDIGVVQTFYEENAKRLFFGNSVELIKKTKDGERKGSLTIGIDATRIVQNLALASHRMAFFASNGHILKGYGTNGKEIPEIYSMIPLNEILSGKTGIVELADGLKYFFLTMQPFPDQEFYFFLLNPLKEEFALIYSVDKNAKEMLTQVAIQTHIIIFIALIIIIIVAQLISKHITKPISLLSEATSMVSQGKLDEVKLPPIKKKKKDEVEALYHAFYKMIEELKEKEKVKGVLNKVVSPMIADEILKGNVQLGGEEKIVTVLFADIRHFSEISEKMLPNEVIGMLNACMTKISHVIDEHGGVIDKYVGDEVMALFGAPISSSDSAVKAIECGIEMLRVIDEWNNQREQEGAGKRIQMGIGIHTGVVVAGNMGAEDRLNYTVLGANVNLASRLCSKAAEQQILVSKETLSQPFVRDRIDYEELQPIELKGFSQPVHIFSVKGKK